MRQRTALWAASALALTIAVSASAPAQADVTETLPEGEFLYAVECEDSEGGFGTIDPATADVTLIGSGSTDPNVTCAGMAAYNAVNGLGYWSSWDTPGDLFSVDLTTGAHTFIGFIEFAEGPEFWIEHMAIGPNGVGYGITNDNDGGSPQLVSIDLATAQATLIGEFGVDEGNSDWWSLAYNPADGQFYATSQSTRELYRVDVATGGLTALGVHGDNWIWFGISFDSEGTIWSACTGPDRGCSVGRTTIADWTTAGVSELGNETAVDGTTWFTEATFINYPVDDVVVVVEPPQLAATGPGETGLLMALGVALLAAGTTSVVLRRAGRTRVGAIV